MCLGLDTTSRVRRCLGGDSLRGSTEEVAEVRLPPRLCAENQLDKTHGIVAVSCGDRTLLFEKVSLTHEIRHAEL